jgi:hypothetical protein
VLYTCVQFAADKRRAQRSSALRVRGRRYWLAAALVIGSASSAGAQVLESSPLPVAPPWDAVQVFEPSPLPQLASPEELARVAPEDTPVKIRQQPGYEDIGIRAGSWMINPSLTTGGFFDSNVFSSNTMKSSDFATLVEPNVSAHTLWGEHAINLQADVQDFRYLNNPGLDETDVTLKGTGQFDLHHDAQILTSFEAASLHEGVGTLSSPFGAVQPTPYDLFSGDVTYRQEFNRLTASVGSRVDSYSYGSTVAQNGSAIDESFRGGQIYTEHARFDYAVSPTLGLFTAGEVNERDLRGMPGAPLTSQGERVLAGFDVAFTPLITGEIGAGYVSQHFDDALIGTVEGPTYRAIVNWSPTRSLDIYFKAEQLVTETADTTSAGVRANGAQLGADYEIFRNVVYSTTAAYENENFYGQARLDNVYSIDSRLKYQFNRFSSIELWYKFVQRDSNMPVFSFDKHQVGINVKMQF